MRRLSMLEAATVLPLLLIAACDGEPRALFSGDPPASLPIQSVKASFPLHGIADAIVVDAADRLPLRAAALVAPDGSATPARSIDVDSRPGFAGGQRLLQDPWRSAVATTGSATAIGTAGDLAMTSVQSQAQLGIMLSTASIAIPDPVAYRKDWAHYKIRLDFGMSPNTGETREIAAPAPPPG